jgi:NAD(P)-dependent dehydrogenase (short-subunit alcohol dehydrogenase family)
MSRNRSSKPGHPIAGRVVAITGAGRGIGAATARALHAAGAIVVLGDLDAELVRQLAAELDRAGAGRAFAGPLDVTDRKSFSAFLDLADEQAGGLDVLVNNAGIMPLADLADEPDDVTRRIVEVNLHGVLLGTKLAAARFRATGGGRAVPPHIVNLASGVGRIALPGAATYSASKFAVVGLSEAMRAELRDVPVEVSCVLPVVVNTELTAGLGTMKGQRTIEPDEVAAAILATVQKPRFEVWVPASAGRIYRVMSLFPRSVGEGLGRVMGTTEILRRVDASARAGYIRRTVGRSAAPTPSGEPAAAARPEPSRTASTTGPESGSRR